MAGNIFSNIYKFVFSRFMEFGRRTDRNTTIRNKREQLFFDLHHPDIHPQPEADVRPSSSESRPRSTISHRPKTILEIGVGSGANFQYYPKGSEVICVDPNPYYASYLAERSKEFPHLKLKFESADAAKMTSVDSDSMDAVVCTLVLCSVADVDRVLREVHRVLKPGGKFYFLEHVSGDEGSWLLKVQTAFNPIWPVLFDGCHLTRQTWRAIDSVGFSNVSYEKFKLKDKSPMWIIHERLIGSATK